jgi:hypothetical protein
MQFCLWDWDPALAAVVKLRMTTPFSLWQLNSESNSYTLSWKHLHMKLRVVDTEGIFSSFMEATQTQIQGLLPLNLILYQNHGCFDYLHEHWNYFFDYWRKCLVIVFSLLLGESSGHKSGFVHLYIVICNILYLLYQSLKSPLTSLLVSRKNPYPSPSNWLPRLSLKQGNLPRIFHIS